MIGRPWGDGVGEAVEALGGCDAVIANAGVVDTIRRADRFPEEDWHKDVETNLSGAFFLAQAAFPALVESGDGRVVVISSVAAEVGLPGQAAYGASKAGLVGLARTLAGEWASAGVRCNVVMPGMIATPKVLAMPGKLQDSLKRTIPLGRFGAPEELAGVVGFLLTYPAVGCQVPAWENSAGGPWACWIQRCARAPGLTSVRGPGSWWAGDEMFDGVIPLGEALRPLNLSRRSTRVACRQQDFGSRPRRIGLSEGLPRAKVSKFVFGSSGLAGTRCDTARPKPGSSGQGIRAPAGCHGLGRGWAAA